MIVDSVKKPLTGGRLRDNVTGQIQAMTRFLDEVDCLFLVLRKIDDNIEIAVKLHPVFGNRTKY